MLQITLTPAAGKRLIAKALSTYQPVLDILKTGTIVIVAGTTNGHVAEELLLKCGQAEGFSRKKFFRGVTLPADKIAPEPNLFLGDVIIQRGTWLQGKNIFDVADDLQAGDIILKGANALNLASRQAAVLIGHPSGGTTGAALRAVKERGARLILPVGLEKRVDKDLHALAARVNTSDFTGLRLQPVAGELFTEIDAIALLSGARAELLAAGGVAGAEGAVRLIVTGSAEQEALAEKLIKEIVAEPMFSLN